MLKAASMMFDLEVDESCQYSGADDCTHARIALELDAFTHPKSVAGYKLRIEVDALTQYGALDSSDLAAALCSLGYHTLIRTSLGGEPGIDCIRNLRHTFLICTPPGPLARCGNQLIVDTRFRECFEIAKPTARYLNVLAAVPPTFVGTLDSLSSVVSLLCSEMEAAFAATGAVLPPWRQARSMLSKWQPRRSMDERISDDGTATPVIAALEWEQARDAAGDVIGPGSASGSSPRGTVSPPSSANGWRKWVSSTTTLSRTQSGSTVAEDGASSKLPRQRSNLSAQLDAVRDFFKQGVLDASSGKQPILCALAG